MYADNRDVSRYFARRGDTFTARLPRKLLIAGTNRLLVQAITGAGNGGAAAVSFILDRSAPGLMRVASGRAAASGLTAGSANTGGYQPIAGAAPVAIHTTTPTYARLTVNGHRVPDLRASRQLMDHGWLVSMRDGLKAGRNVLMVESWDATDAMRSSAGRSP